MNFFGCLCIDNHCVFVYILIVLMHLLNVERAYLIVITAMNKLWYLSKNCIRYVSDLLSSFLPEPYNSKKKQPESSSSLKKSHFIIVDQRDNNTASRKLRRTQ